MDQRLSCWLNGQNLKAPGARIAQLFYASWLRLMLKLAALLRLKKLLNRRCKRLRSKATPLWPTLSETKSRFTTWVCRIISNGRGAARPSLPFGFPFTRLLLIHRIDFADRNVLPVKSDVPLKKVRKAEIALAGGYLHTLFGCFDGLRKSAGLRVSSRQRPEKLWISTI